MVLSVKQLLHLRLRQGEEDACIKQELPFLQLVGSIHHVSTLSAIEATGYSDLAIGNPMFRYTDCRRVSRGSGPVQRRVGQRSQRRSFQGASKRLTERSFRILILP